MERSQPRHSTEHNLPLNEHLKSIITSDIDPPSSVRNDEQKKAINIESKLKARKDPT